MLRLLRFLRPELGLALTALGLSFLAVGAQVGLLGTSAYLISRAALRPPTLLLLMVPIVGVQFFSIGRSALRYLERLTSHDVTFRLLANLRVFLFARIEAADPSALRGLHSSDLATRAVQDIESLQDFYLRAVAPPVVLVLTALLALLVLWPMASTAAWVVAGLLLLGLGPAALHVRTGRLFGGAVLTERAALAAALADGVRGATELAVYGLSDGYARDLALRQDRMLAAQLRLRRSAAMSSALESLLGNVAMLAAIVLAIPLVRAGRMPGWDLAVVAMVALAGFEAAQPLPQSFQALGRCLAAAGRVFAVADSPAAAQAEPRTPEQPRGSTIEVRDLTVRYPDASGPALRGVDLDLPPGRHVAVVGPNGAGKSSLCRALTGFAPVSKDSVRIGGARLEAIPRSELWALCAVVRQEATLFNASLRENIRIGRAGATDEEVLQAALDAGLGALIDALPQGLDDLVGEEGARLSGGERQRVAIARALVRKAPVLIADEPTEGLDALTAEGVLRSLLRAAEGRTLLLVTHRLLGLEGMDEVLVLQDGLVAERGRHEDLARAGGLYQTLLDLQSDRLDPI